MTTESDDAKLAELMKSPSFLFKMLRTVGIAAATLISVAAVYFTIQKRLDQHDMMITDMRAKVERIDTSMSQAMITQAVVLQRLESLRVLLDTQTRLIEGIILAQRAKP